MPRGSTTEGYKYKNNPTKYNLPMQPRNRWPGWNDRIGLACFRRSGCRNLSVCWARELPSFLVGRRKPTCTKFIWMRSHSKMLFYISIRVLSIYMHGGIQVNYLLERVSVVVAVGKFIYIMWVTCWWRVIYLSPETRLQKYFFAAKPFNECVECITWNKQ